MRLIGLRQYAVLPLFEVIYVFFSKSAIYQSVCFKSIDEIISNCGSVSNICRCFIMNRGFVLIFWRIEFFDSLTAI